MTKIFAGGDFPAAVIWPVHIGKERIEMTSSFESTSLPVKNLPKLFAASMTALYPAMLAIELSASKTLKKKIHHVC
jgi:hypothetical protein